MRNNKVKIKIIDNDNKLDVAYLMNKGINFIGEEDFFDTMNGQGRQWRKDKVENADFISFDGSKLCYYYSMPKEAKATIVIIHGFCEFWGKYHELAWYLHQAGYGFFFLEQRGHGHSDRDACRLDLVHLDSYSQYVEDVHRFVDEVVIPANGKRDLYLYAHSMGGATGALFLEQYPQYFKKAILSSPMFDMKTDNIPKVVISAYMVYLKAMGKMKELSKGQNYFDGKPVFEASSCQSKARYDYQFEQRLKNKLYQTYGATFGWINASLIANRKLLRYAGKVNIPILMFAAGNDHLVNFDGQLKFAERSSNTRIVEYKEAKHELFNSLDYVRVDYYGRIFDFLDEA